MITSHPQHRLRLAERLQVFMEAKEDFCQKDARFEYFKVRKNQAYEERDASYRKFDDARTQLIQLIDAATTGEDGLPLPDLMEQPK